MSLQYSEQIFDSLIDLFDRFILQTTFSISSASQGYFNGGPVSENELLTASEAKNTLRQLIERVRAGG